MSSGGGSNQSATQDGANVRVVPNQSLTAVESGVSSIQTALASLLDSARTAFSLESAVFSYDVSASLQASVTGSITVLPDVLVLQEVRLSVDVSKGSNAPAVLQISLTALCTIGGWAFRVTGSIPEYTAGQKFTLTLSLVAADLLDSVDVGSVLGALNLSPDSEVLSNTSTGVADALTGSCIGSLSLSLVLGAQVTTYLSSASVIIATRRDWKLAPSLVLRNTGFALRASRVPGSSELAPPGAWDFVCAAEGTVVLDDDVTVAAQAVVELSKDAGTVRISLFAGNTANISPLQLLKAKGPSTASVDAVSGAFAAPDSLKTQFNDALQATPTAFSATLTVRRIGGTWQLTMLRMDLFVGTIGLDDLTGDATIPLGLFNTYFRVVAVKDTAVTPATWAYSAVVGGTVDWGRGMFLISLEGEYTKPANAVSKASLRGRVRDGSFAPLSSLARMPELIAGQTMPADYKPPDLVATAKAKPAPLSSPVVLAASVDSSFGDSDKGFDLIFVDGGMTRATFRAEQGGSWPLTNSLSLDKLSVYFNIDNPRTPGKRMIQGYVYGVIRAPPLTLYGFVAGSSVPEASRFWVSVTGTYDPTATLGVSARTALGAATFGSIGSDTSWQTGWTMPQPEDMPTSDNVTTNVGARLLVQVSRTQQTVTTPPTWVTKLEAAKVQLAASATWRIYDDVVLAAGIQVSVLWIAPLTPSDTASAAVEVLGTLAIPSSAYDLVLAGSFRKSSKRPTEITVVASIRGKLAPSASDTTSLPAPGDIASMSAFGSKSVTSAVQTTQWPSDFTTRPSAITSTDITSTRMHLELLVARPATTDDSAYALKQIRFSLDVADTLSWVVGNYTCSLDKVAIRLTATDPRTSNASYVFDARGTLDVTTIGNSRLFSLGVLAEVVSGPTARGPQGSLHLKVLAGASVSQIFSALLPSDNAISIPSEARDRFPSITGSDLPQSASLDIWLAKAAGEANWGVQEAFVVVEANQDSSLWDIGPITLKRLQFVAHWKKTGTSTALDMFLRADTTFNGIAATVEGRFTGTKLVLGLGIGGSNAKPTDILEQFMGEAPADAPELPEETGLDSYMSTAPATLIMTFTKAAGDDGTWSPESLVLTFNSPRDENNRPREWELYGDVIKLTGMSARLEVRDLSSETPRLDLRLEATLATLDPDDDTTYLTTKATLTAKDSQIDLLVRLAPNCNLRTVLYLGSGGRWDIETNWGPSVEYVRLFLDWRAKKGAFTVGCADWETDIIYSYQIKDVLANVTFSEGTTSSLSVGGSLSGVVGLPVALLGVQVGTFDVPVEYVLPDGPLLIFGLDVELIYDIVTKLYRLAMLIGDIAGAVEAIVAFLAEVLPVVAAAAVVAALVALGVPLALALDAVSRYFGTQGQIGQSVPIDDDGGYRDTSNPGAWSIGGLGTAVGVAGESTWVRIFAKDAKDQIVRINEQSLELKVGTVGSTSQPLGYSKFEVIPNGVECWFDRPSTNGPYNVQAVYNGTVICSTTGEVKDTVGVLTASTTRVDAPVNWPAGETCYVTVWPKDQFGNARHGHDERGRFQVTLQSPGFNSVVPYIELRQDCYRLRFTLPVEGVWTLSAKLNGVELLDPLHTIQSQLTVSQRNTVVYGDGVCAGIAGASTSFQIRLADHDNNEFTGEATCEAVLRSGAISQVLTVTGSGAYRSCLYTRPATPGQQYSLTVTANGRRVAESPYTLDVVAAAATAPVVSVANSLVSLLVKPMLATGSNSAVPTLYGGTRILIQSMDDSGRRYRVGGADRFKIRVYQADLGSDQTSVDEWATDYSDGTYRATVLSSTPGTWMIEVTDPATFGTPTVVHARGSPMEVKIVSPPALGAPRCLGPGLSTGPPGRPTYFDVAPLDQYGGDFPDPFDRLVLTSQVVAASSGTVAMPLPSISKTERINGVWRVYYTRPAQAGSYYIRIAVNTKIPDPEDPVAFTSGPLVEASMSPFLVRAADYDTYYPPSPAKTQTWFVDPRQATDILRSAVVTVVDGTGARRFWGGEAVGATYGLPPNDPHTGLTGTQGRIVGVQDLLDGTYKILILKDDHDGGSVAITTRQSSVLNSPFAFPPAAKSIITANANYYELYDSFSVSLTSVPNIITPSVAVRGILFPVDMASTQPILLLQTTAPTTTEFSICTATGPAGSLSATEYRCEIYLNEYPRISLAVHPMSFLTVPSPGAGTFFGTSVTGGYFGSLLVPIADPDQRGDVPMSTLIIKQDSGPSDGRYVLRMTTAGLVLTTGFDVAGTYTCSLCDTAGTKPARGESPRVLQSGITFTVFDVLRDIVPFVSGFSPHPLAPIDAVSTTNVVADTAREFENGSYGVRFTPAANPAVNTKAVGSLALRLPLQSLGTGFMVTFKLRVVGMPGGAGTTLRVMSPLQLGPDSNIDQRNSLSLRVTNTPSGGTTNPPGWSIRGFPSVGSSRIQPGDGTAASVGFHEVSFLYQAKQTAVLEDGVLVGVAPIGPIVPPRVSNDPAAAATDWALQASIALEGLVSSGAAATFTADVADIATFPLDGHFDSPTPYVSTSPNELVFNVASAAYLAAAPVAYSIRGRPQRSDPSAAQDALWVAGTDCTVFDAASKNLTSAYGRITGPPYAQTGTVPYRTTLKVYTFRVRGPTAGQTIEIQFSGGAYLVGEPPAGSDGSKPATWRWVVANPAAGTKGADPYLASRPHPRAAAPATTPSPFGSLSTTWVTAAVAVTGREVSVFTREGLVLWTDNSGPVTGSPVAGAVFNVKLDTSGASALAAIVELKSIRQWP